MLTKQIRLPRWQGMYCLLLVKKIQFRLTNELVLVNFDALFTVSKKKHLPAK